MNIDSKKSWYLIQLVSRSDLQLLTPTWSLIDSQMMMMIIMIKRHCWGRVRPRSFQGLREAYSSIISYIVHNTKFELPTSQNDKNTKNRRNLERSPYQAHNMTHCVIWKKRLCSVLQQNSALHKNAQQSSNSAIVYLKKCWSHGNSPVHFKLIEEK